MPIAEIIKPTSRFDSIQMLRGLAALAVFSYHAIGNFQLDVPEVPYWLKSTFRHGSVGVDVFFCISGFVMAWTALIARDVPEDPIQFALKRFFRVIPLYFIAMILNVYFNSKASWFDTWRSLLFLPLSTGQPPFYGYSALIVGWSLNYEIYFYAVLTVALFFKRATPLIVCAYFLCIVILVPLAQFGIWNLDPAHGAAFVRPYFDMASNPLVLEFLFGFCSAYIYSFLRDRISGWASLLLAGASVLIFIWSVETYPGEFSLLWRGIPSALLLLSFVLAEHKGMLKVPAPLVQLGNISFGVYLIHALVVPNIALTRIPPEYLHLKIFQYLIAGGLTILASALAYRFIEMPANNWGRSVSQRVAAARGNFSRLYKTT
jgi:peptidoglycan/LPS O-acetylase OafA/YrhL